MVHIELTHQAGYRWFVVQNISVKGYLFDEENNFYRDGELFHYFKDVISLKEFEAKLVTANGCFSVVIDTKDNVLCACDRVRSFPLFYGITDDKTVLSDNAYRIAEQLNCKEFDPLNEKEFLMTGYVTGNETLFHGLKQIQAGECLSVSKERNIISSVDYYKFKHDELSADTEDELIKRLDVVHEVVFQRLIRSLNGRQAVIPLSGGQDSRLIAFFLKRLGYTNIICFTYGTPGNKESEVSRLIADQLGFKWHFIPYTKRLWRQWGSSVEFRKYMNFASNLNSIGHIQDFPAVMQLKANKIIEDDAIFIPGHSGDFIAGSHIPNNFMSQEVVSNQILFNEIYNKHYSLWSMPDRDKKKFFDKRVANCLNYLKEYPSTEAAADLFEFWDWRERQAKFIVNSVRVYDYFDYEWRLPLWDQMLMQYWSHIPVTYRYQRKLYFLYANRELTDFVKYDIRLSAPLSQLRRIIKNIFFYDSLRDLNNFFNNIFADKAFFGLINKRDLLRYIFLKMSNINSFLAKKYINKVFLNRS
ncbi:MAG: asparagine synthase C-terminal domain-containing protein [Candidatus Omnitrophota bacterium]